MASRLCPCIAVTLACCKETEPKKPIFIEETLMKSNPETSGEGERERLSIKAWSGLGLLVFFY